jgi:primosomal protein N' (replication factor Y)
LQAEISYALKNKLQTILFINRQGMSNFSICTQCKTVLKCPKCDRALIYDKEGIYKCVHCAYKTSITPECSKCNSLSFTNIGLGTQKVEREIVAMFPNARVARADSQNMKTPHAQEILYENFKNGKVDILIGTQMIAKGWDLPNVSLVGIIDGDAMLAFPDFSAREKAFQNIWQAAGRVNRPGAKFPGLVLIQTFNPEQEFFQGIAAGEIEKFYTGELNARKDLSLPPFGRLVKLVCQDLSRKKAATEAQRVSEMLQKISGKNLKISEPQDAFVANIRGRFRKQIIIKISRGLPAELKKILRSLPASWIIDIDPISIL